MLLKDVEKVESGYGSVPCREWYAWKVAGLGNTRQLILFDGQES